MQTILYNDNKWKYIFWLEIYVAHFMVVRQLCIRKVQKTGIIQKRRDFYISNDEWLGRFIVIFYHTIDKFIRNIPVPSLNQFSRLLE